MMAKNSQKGFTLIELLVAMGLSFVVILIIYMAFFISHAFTQKGIKLINDKMDLRILFERLNEDLRFLNRINRISSNLDTIEFEIFNKEIKEILEPSHDKIIGGVVTKIQAKKIPGSDQSILVVEKQENKYEWRSYFGHSQTPEEDGYLMDMKDPTTGKKIIHRGKPTPIMEQERGEELQIQSIKFVPIDVYGNEFRSGGTYENFKNISSIKIEILYLERTFHGEILEAKPVPREVSHIVNLVNFSLVKF